MESFPSAAQCDPAVIKGWYRFLDHPAESALTPEIILPRTASVRSGACKSKARCCACRTEPISTAPSTGATRASVVSGRSSTREEVTDCTCARSWR